MAGRRVGAIAGNSGLPPVVVDQARRQLEIVLHTRGDDVLSFNGAAAAWLARFVPQLAQVTEFDDSAYDKWEMWLAAERELGTGETYQAAVMDALEAIIVAVPT